MADTSALLKTVSQQLRQAQNALFAGKYAEAQAQAESAAASLAGAQVQDPAHAQIRTFETQLAKLRKDLASRADRTASPSHAPAAPAASKPSSPPASPPAPAPAAGLPAGVAKRIRDIQALLTRKKIEDAEGLLTEIDASYGGQFPADHPDYVAARAQVAQARAAHDQARQAGQQASEDARNQQDRMRQQSQPWIDRFRGFAPHGAAIFGTPTQSVSDLLAQKTAYAQALPVWQEFQAQSFPCGKTDELASLETSLARSFGDFQTIFEQCKDQFLAAVLDRLAQQDQALGREHEGLPAVLNPADLEEARRAAAGLAPLLADDPAASRALGKALADLAAHDAGNRVARAGKIVPRDDAYAGPDAEDIRDCVRQLVLKSVPAARILKTVIYKSDWHESTQWEDATGVNRLVTRREIYGQAVADCDGACRLFSVYVTKELRADKTWSALTGNVMHHEDMDRVNAGPLQ